MLVWQSFWPKNLFLVCQTHTSNPSCICWANNQTSVSDAELHIIGHVISNFSLSDVNDSKGSKLYIKKDGINISEINSKFLQDLKTDKHCIRYCQNGIILEDWRRKKGAVTEKFKLTDLFHLTELCFIWKV